MPAETLDILVKMKDFATEELRRLEGQIDHTSTKGSRGFDLFGAAVGRAKTMLLNLGGIMAGYFTGRAIIGAINSTADWADNLEELSQQIGVSTEALSELEYVAGQNGATMDDLETGFRIAQKGLAEFAQTGRGTAAEALRKLAGDTQMLIREGASLEDLLPKISRDIKGLGEADRVLVASQLFGRGGAKLLPMFLSDMEAARQRAREFGLTLRGDTAAAAGEFKDALGDVSAALEGIKRQIILPILPGLSESLTDLSVWLRENRPDILNFAADFTENLETIGSALQQLITLMPKAQDAAKQVSDGVGSVFDWLRNPFGVFGTSPAQVLTKEVEQVESLAGRLRRAANEARDAQGMPSPGGGENPWYSRIQAIDGVTAAQEDWIRAQELSISQTKEEIRAAERLAALEDQIAQRREERAIQEVRDRQDAHAASLQTQANLAAENAQYREAHDFMAGAGKKLRELQAESQRFGDVAGRAIEGVGAALSYGIVDVLIQAQQEGANLREVLTAIGFDIQRIFLNEAISLGVKAAFGGIGSLLGIPSMQVGGPVLSTGLHYLHAGEQVLPPSEAREYRGGGGTPVALSINVAVSGQDVRGTPSDIDRRGRSLGIAIASEIRQSRVLQQAIREAAR